MPAPLNTPPDRCNILDISSSSFIELPFFPSFSSFLSASIPHRIPSLMLIFALLIMNTEQRRRCCDQAYMWTRSRMCAKTWLRLCRFHSRLLSKCVLYPSLPITPFYKSIYKGRGTNPAATPQYHLPGGIKGWLSCYCLSQWDYLLPTAAPLWHLLSQPYAHTLPLLLLFLTPPFFFLSSVSLHLSLFISSCSLICLATAGDGTLHWRAAECQASFRHSHWLRAESSSRPRLVIGPEAHINNAPKSGSSPCGCDYWSVLIG